MNFSPFSCPIFLGPPKSEWLLLPKRAAALWEGTQMLLRAEPGKQRPRSCRTQELARSSGPRKCVAGKGWLTRLGESQYGRTTSTCETKKTVANVLAQVLPVGRTAQKRGRDSIVSLGLGNPGRGEDPEKGQRGSKSVTAAPWKSPIMAWSTFCDDYFRVADDTPAMQEKEWTSVPI